MQLFLDHAFYSPSVEILCKYSLYVHLLQGKGTQESFTVTLAMDFKQ